MSGQIHVFMKSITCTISQSIQHTNLMFSIDGEQDEVHKEAN